MVWHDSPDSSPSIVHAPPTRAGALPKASTGGRRRSERRRLQDTFEPPLERPCASLDVSSLLASRRATPRRVERVDHGGRRGRRRAGAMVQRATPSPSSSSSDARRTSSGCRRPSSTCASVTVVTPLGYEGSRTVASEGSSGPGRRPFDRSNPMLYVAEK
jgi:hypothetical protein